MLDKVQLNNQLVANKLKLQKVKVHVINKLVRKIKKTKLLSEKHPDNVKLKRRIERTTEILNCLKKIKNTEALKTFLVYERNPALVIASDKSSNVEIAHALLCSNKVCSEIVEHLKEVLLLNDDNPGWREQLLEPSKKEKKVKGKEKKGTKSKDNSNNVAKNKIGIGKDSQSQNRNLKETSELGTEDTEECRAANNPGEAFNINVSDKPLKTNADNRKIKISDGIQNQKRNVTEVKQRRRRRQDHVAVADPFFITSSGENYLANIDLNPQNEAEEERNNRYEKNNKQHIFNNRKQKPDYLSNNASGKTFRKTSNKFEGGLHPSWEAKRRKNNVGELTGKKKTFEDSKPKQTTTANNTEKLHPSWAAKQKLKPSISVFKGTKIVFDD